MCPWKWNGCLWACSGQRTSRSSRNFCHAGEATEGWRRCRQNLHPWRGGRPDSAKEDLAEGKKEGISPWAARGHSVRTAGCPAEKECVLRGVTDLTGTCRLPWDPERALIIEDGAPSAWQATQKSDSFSQLHGATTAACCIIQPGHPRDSPNLQPLLPCLSACCRWTRDHAQ